MCQSTIPTYMHTYMHTLPVCFNDAHTVGHPHSLQYTCIAAPSPLFCSLLLQHTQITVAIRRVVSPRHKRVAMISITQPLNPTPKQLIAFGSPAKEQDGEVWETMLLCVAFAFIKACTLLSVAHLTCAAEDLLLCGLLLLHTRAYKYLLVLIGLIYLSIVYEIYCLF